MFTEKTYYAQCLPDNMKSFVPSIVCLFLLNVGFPAAAEGMLRLLCKGTVYFYLHYHLPPPPPPTLPFSTSSGTGRHRAYRNLSSITGWEGGGGEALVVVISESNLMTTSRRMPRHIRDLNVESARDFKFNQAARWSNNKENDQKIADNACLFRVYIRLWLYVV